jgi:hypothetical protein
MSGSTPLNALAILLRKSEDFLGLAIGVFFYLVGFLNLATLAAPLGLFTFGAVFALRGLILGAFRLLELLILVLHWGLGLLDVLKSLCADAGLCEQKNAVPFICTTMSAPR